MIEKRISDTKIIKRYSWVLLGSPGAVEVPVVTLPLLAQTPVQVYKKGRYAGVHWDPSV